MHITIIRHDVITFNFKCFHLLLTLKYLNNNTNDVSNFDNCNYEFHRNNIYSISLKKKKMFLHSTLARNVVNHILLLFF